MVKNLLCLVLMACLSDPAIAQTDSIPIYLRFPEVPPFLITKVPDSTKFTKDDLSKRKATIIIIFSPDCDHCQHEIKELTEHIELFKKVQIILASPLEYAHLKKFYEDYKIAGYPSIIMGRDPSYFFGTFYRVRTFPSIFVYDKKGKFINSFEGPVPVEKIADIL